MITTQPKVIFSISRKVARIDIARARMIKPSLSACEDQRMSDGKNVTSNADSFATRTLLKRFIAV